MSWGDFIDPTPTKKRRRRKRGRVSPTGPYPAESSVKSIREKTTSAEKRRFSREKSRTAERARNLARGDRREERAERREGPSARDVERQVRRTYEEIDEDVPRSIETLLRAERRLERRENKKLREATKRLRAALASEAAFKARQPSAEGSGGFPERGLEKLAPKAYEKAYSAALRAGSSGGLGEPEDLTLAITSLAPGAGFAGALGKRAVDVGGKKVAREVAEAAAGKIESTAARVTRAGSGVKAGGRMAGNAARRAAGKAPKARPAPKMAESRFAQISLPGAKLGKAGGSQAFPVVRGHEQAIVDEPKKTAKTTLRALPGLVTAPVAMAADVGISGGRAASSAAHELGIPGAAGYTGEEILAPVKHIPAEQLAFAKQVAAVVTASDTAEVKKEVEDNLGLMLPIMLGLTTGAVGKKISKGRITEGVRRIAERSRERRGKAHGYRDGKAPRVLERTGQRKEAAKIAARGRNRLKVELDDRQRGMLEAARGATESEVVRKGVTRGKRGKKRDLKIHDADVASFLQRHPMNLDDPVAMLAEVNRIEKRLKPIPEGVTPSPDKLYTRDVIEHIKRKPDVLANPAVIAVVRQYRKQGRHARETPGLAPEHSERARFLSAATTRDIAFPEERHPRSIRDVVRAEPQRGKLSKDVLKREARRDRSRGRALRKKAAAAEKKAAIMRRELETREKLNKDRLEQPLAGWQKKELANLKALEKRGLIPKRTSHTKRPKKTLPKLHDRLRERIDKLDVAAVTLREKADAADAMAVRKVKASREVDESLTKEFADVVTARLAGEGINELPEYQHAGTGRQHGAPVYGSSGSKLTQFPGASKQRKGTAEEMGLVEEGLRPMIRESIARPLSRRESYKAARDVLERNRFAPGGKVEWSAKDADELFQGADPVLSSEQWMKVPRQFYKRIYDVLEGKGKGKGITDADFKMVGQLEAMRDGKGPVGSHYQIVRKASMDELVSQLANTLVAPKIAKVNRATSFLILGTSPAWAAMQIIAEYGQASIAQPRLLNPAFVKKAMRAYKEMSPEKRQAFDSWVGVTTRTIERAEDLKLDLKAGDMDAAAHAYTALEATPYGRFIRGIPTSIARIDQWKGGRIRSLTALAKMDSELNGRVNRFIRGIGGVNKEMGAALKEMRGKSFKEQAEWVAEHPKWAHRYQSYLDDVMGNWSALTKNERVAAQAMIFYPFVRMSLRWTFYAFPKRHPIKASMLYYLGQQNANELHKLLKGDPSYFTQWAMVPVDLGGEKKLIDLSRIAPGSNVLVEALGGSTEGPEGIAAAKLAQPALAALGTAIYGVSPLSGKQEGGSGWNALAQMLSLSPLTRVAGEAAIPSGRKKGEGAGQLPVVGSFSTERQEALDRLSAELREYDTPQRLVRQLALPPLPKEAGKEADSALLGRVLKAFEKNSSSARDDLSAEYATRMKNAVEEGKRPTLRRFKKERDKRLGEMEAEYDEADRVLDTLFDRYGIEHEKEDRLFLEFYGEGKYGTGDDDNPWSASFDSGNNPWSQAGESEGDNPWSGK